MATSCTHENCDQPALVLKGVPAKERFCGDHRCANHILDEPGFKMLDGLDMCSYCNKCTAACDYPGCRGKGVRHDRISLVNYCPAHACPNNKVYGGCWSMVLPGQEYCGGCLSLLQETDESSSCTAASLSPPHRRRPFQCPDCPRAYAQRQSLVRHVREKHAAPPPPREEEEVAAAVADDDDEAFWADFFAAVHVAPVPAPAPPTVESLYEAHRAAEAAHAATKAALRARLEAELQAAAQKKREAEATEAALHETLAKLG